MIASNYIKHPEALRFQFEMFSNGYHNSPRIMRLMEVFFEWTAAVPQWFIDQRSRAKQLVKAWKSRIVEMFEMAKTKAKNIDPRQLELVLFPAPEPEKYWLGDAPKKMAIFPPETYIGSKRWKPDLTITTADWSEEQCLKREGCFRSFCRKHQGGFQGTAKRLTGHYGSIVTCSVSM